MNILGPHESKEKFIEILVNGHTAYTYLMCDEAEAKRDLAHMMTVGRDNLQDPFHEDIETLEIIIGGRIVWRKNLLEAAAQQRAAGLAILEQRMRSDGARAAPLLYPRRSSLPSMPPSPLVVSSASPSQMRFEEYLGPKGRRMYRPIRERYRP